MPSAALEHLVTYADGLADVVASHPGVYCLGIPPDVGDTYRELLDLPDPDVPARDRRSHH